MVKADLHNHIFTGDGHDNPQMKGLLNKIANKAAKKLGPGGIVGIIDFSGNRWKHLLKSKGYDIIYLGNNKNAIYIPEKDIILVHGQEVPTKQGHLLVLGTEYGHQIKEHQTIEKTLEEVIKKGNIAIPTHMDNFYGLGKYLRKKPSLLKKIDALEIHNREAIGTNWKTKAFYKKIIEQFPHLGALSSSDGHSIFEIGSGWTEIIPPKKDKYFVESLRTSIRKTNLDTPKKTGISIAGAIKHGAELVLKKHLPAHKVF
jgi:hypothetical protein